MFGNREDRTSGGSEVDGTFGLRSRISKDERDKLRAEQLVRDKIASDRIEASALPEAR